MTTTGTSTTGRPARKPHYDLAVEPRQRPDPGDGGRLGPAGDAYVLLVTSHAGPGETRLLSDPLYTGQTLDLFFETDSGDCVITADSAINQSGNNTLLFEDIGDHIRLVGGRDGAGGREWRVIANDGITLSTV